MSNVHTQFEFESYELKHAVQQLDGIPIPVRPAHSGEVFSLIF